MRSAAIAAVLFFCACGGQDRSTSGTQGSQELQLARAHAAAASSADGKVTICHVPPGNPENAHEISVGEPAVRAHLEHGDLVGACCEAAGECCVPSDGTCEADEDCCGNGDLICSEGQCVTP